MPSGVDGDEGKVPAAFALPQAGPGFPPPDPPSTAPGSDRAPSTRPHAVAVTVLLDMDVDVRVLTDGDMDAAWALSSEAFNVAAARRVPFLATAVPERFHGAFVGSRLVAMCRAHGFGQFFGCRAVPMGGLASVAVAAEERGKGYASAVVSASVEAMRARGEVISALMPATTRLYRGLG